jgi:beta propeller repeat protein
VVVHTLSTGRTEELDETFGFPYQVDVFDGVLVWVEMKGDDLTGLWEVTLYDIDQEEEIFEMDVFLPDVHLDGDTLTYIEATSTGAAIREMDITGGDSKLLYRCESGAHDIDRHGDMLVWSDDRYDTGNSILDENRDIYIYDIENHIEARITTDDEMQGDPAIYGDMIVWVDERNGDEDIYAYDLTSDTDSNGEPDYMDWGIRVGGHDTDDDTVQYDPFCLTIAIASNITFVVVVAALIIVYMRKKKKETAGTPPGYPPASPGATPVQPGAAPMPPGSAMASAGPPSGPGRPPPVGYQQPPSPPSVCTACGAPLQWDHGYQRYWCGMCGKHI